MCKLNYGIVMSNKSLEDNVMSSVEINTGDTAISIFERCKTDIKTMLYTIQKQLHYYENDQEHLLNEAQARWVECFDKYEEDKQYLHYMFVVMKNKVRDIRRLQYRYSNTHISDPAKLATAFTDTGEATGHVRAWNEMAVDKEPMVVETMVISETINSIEEQLTKDLHKKVFKLLVSGLTHKEVAEELGFSTGHIAQIRAKFIWPVVKEVMKIDDDVYDLLISSGRIYFAG